MVEMTSSNGRLGRRSQVEKKATSSAKSLIQEKSVEAYEYNTFLYYLTIPLMEFFAQWVRLKKRIAGKQSVRTNLWCYDGASPELQRIREGAARWPALDVIYNWRKPSQKGINGWIEKFWLGMRNAQAVRNRYKIVKSLIRKNAQKRLSDNGCVRILSLASGSAQSVFEATEGMKNVHLILVDADQTALDHSRELAKKYDATSVEYHKLNVLSKAALSGDFRPDIVEVVGLFDYLSPEAIATTLKRIRAILPENGIVITGHIHPNMEQNFLKEVSDWDYRMKYRTLDELERIVCAGSFEQASYYREPHGIHTVVEGVKF